LKTLLIDGHRIYNYIISGANNLICSEQNLNKINVFPVADGDTGTNLALTMKTIVTKSKKDMNFHNSMLSISRVAVENAYGNSGMIFAQYLNGFAIETKEKEKLTIEEFVEIAGKAANYAYEAVASPKEGTILSIMKGWALELKTNSNILDFEKMFEKSIEKVKAMVDETKFKLKVLMEYNVVDAGAKGFLIFLEGILQFMKSGTTQLVYQETDLTLNEHTNIIMNNEVTNNRYCSQFFIETKKSAAYFKDKLSEYGDSLVVTGSESHLHIHIHSDVPEKVMAFLLSEGMMLSQKIEDMKLMSDIIHRRKYSIGIVTDSIADLPKSFTDAEQITIIPVNLICDSVVYLDKLTMTPEIFYQNANTYKMNPTSAQPSSTVIEKAYSTLLQHFDSVIGIFVSKEMSGTFDNAQRVAREFSQNGKKISIINSKLNSSAEGLLVMKAAELIGQGLSHEEVVEKLEMTREKIHIYVSVKDLSNMIKGGRISKSMGFLLQKIHLKPVVSIDKTGKGSIYKKTLSQKSASSKILSKISRDMKKSGIEQYAIVYSNAMEDIQNIQDKLVKLTGMQPSFVEPISPVVGLNAGMGAFAVSYLKGGQT